MKQNYKTSRKYKCPYCEKTAQRPDLITHVEKDHQDVIPENYTAARAVYDSVNGKNYGICMICKKKVYEWNPKVNRYRNLCDNPKCKAKVRENALERHIKVYNKPTLLNDPEQQEKMLANRRISGTYVFTDGTKMTYTGKYEKNALEFMDKVLEIPAKDIQAPGPVLEYEFEGETHRWITDIYYIPANLLIEIKDGGSNPNTRSMPSYRAKQIAKETMITNLGTFNYVRLTNNDFSQLLDILADMKTEVLEEENPKMKIHINEEVGGLPKHGPPAAYIVPYGMNNAFTGSSGLAYSDSEMDSMLIQDPISNEIIPVSKEVFKETAQTNGTYFYYNKNDNILTKIESVHKKLNEYKSLNELIEEFAGCKINRPRDILLSESFSAIDRSIEKKICSFIENAITTDLNSSGNAYVVETKGNVMIKKDLNGFYANITGNFNMSSDYYSDIEELKSSGVIELMQNLYNSNVGSDKDDE